jgi:hypothetical protein
MAFYIAKKAEDELDKMPADLKFLFAKHFQKLRETPSGRHLRHGVPFFVEEVTKQARIVYRLDGDDVYVTRCFSLHKDYERWYQSYK